MLGLQGHEVTYARSKKKSHAADSHLKELQMNRSTAKLGFLEACAFRYVAKMFPPYPDHSSHVLFFLEGAEVLKPWVQTVQTPPEKVLDLLFITSNQIQNTSQEDTRDIWIHREQMICQLTCHFNTHSGFTMIYLIIMVVFHSYVSLPEAKSHSNIIYIHC